MNTKRILHFILLILLYSMHGELFAASCAPLVGTKISMPPYINLNTLLTSKLPLLQSKLDNVINQTTYSALLTEAKFIASTVVNGTIVVTLPDGTVVVDTKKAALNTYANFKAKKINENHNTRISIVDTQLFECGLGVEAQIAGGLTEYFVARRLGPYLASSGTVRISQKNNVVVPCAIVCG